MRCAADAFFFLLVALALVIVFVAVAGGCICDHFLEIKIVEPRISLLSSEAAPEPTLIVEIPEDEPEKPVSEVVVIPER